MSRAAHINDRLLSHWARAQDRRLICFQAPGGFGKTTAASWWADQTGLPTIWLRLELAPGCRDVLTCLTTLGRRLAEGAGVTPEEGEYCLGDLVALARQGFPDGLCLLLDDYHLVANPELDAAVMELLTRLEPLKRLLVTSRTEITLPLLSRWIGRGDALLLLEEDLRLTTADIAAFCQLSAAAASDLHERSQGWFVALNLLQESRHYGGSSKRIYDEQFQRYLYEDLLSQYDPELVRFLEITALMSGFTLDDCRALGLEGAEHHLERLRRDRSFLSLTDEGVTCHAVVRQALVEHLPAEDRREWQLRIARHRFAQRHESCLPLYLAAGAFSEACKAIAWLHKARWLDPTHAGTMLRHWFEQLPGERLGNDPWYLLLHYFVARQTWDATIRMGLIERLDAAFAAADEHEGTAYVLGCLAELLMQVEDGARIRALLPRMTAARQRLPADHPAAQYLQDVILRVYSTDSGTDRTRWEATLAEQLGTPLVTPLARSRQYLQCLHAAERYLHWGEYGASLSYLERAGDIVRRVSTYRAHLALFQSYLAEYRAFAPVIDPETAASFIAEEARATPQLAAFGLLASAVTAWTQGDQEAAGTAYAAFVAFFDTHSPALYRNLLSHAHLRLGHLAQRQGDFAKARRAYRAAQAHDQSGLRRAEIAWYLAWWHAAQGEREQALSQLAAAEVTAREELSQFQLARALLLRASMTGEPVDDEALALIDRWQYRYALAHLYPEGLALLDGEPAGPAAAPRVRIETLGGLRLVVDGVEVAWKRTNGQLVLLDLLLHPEGSSAKDMELRYWRVTGNQGLRTDILALRQSLEPDVAGKDSRYVTAAGGLYRWTKDRNLYWWDVEAFEALAREALAGDGPRAAAARKEALALYRGPFVPEIQGHAGIANRRQHLAALFERLRP